MNKKGADTMIKRGVYNREGELLGYVEGAAVYDRDGVQTGRIDGRTVVDLDGNRRWLLDGDAVLDMRGNVIGYMGDEVSRDND